MRQKHFYILSQYVLLGVGETYIVCKVIKIFVNAMKKNKKKHSYLHYSPKKNGSLALANHQNKKATL